MFAGNLGNVNVSAGVLTSEVVFECKPVSQNTFFQTIPNFLIAHLWYFQTRDDVKLTSEICIGGF